MNIIKKLLFNAHNNRKLLDWDPDNIFNRNPKDLEAGLPKLYAKMSELQYRMYVEKKTSLLIILQGMDTSGKDGTISHVITAFHPVSCRVETFKIPSPEDLAHDYLWRIHKVVPQRGFIGVFNRSHYEDVVEVRVQNLVPRTVWSPRYDQINQFERYVAENNVKVIKFFLHISKQEQKKRLLERLSDPAKRWKVNEDDFKKRKKWDQYMQAYGDAISRCTTRWAPWYIIPANKKWFRNWAIAKIIVETLEQMKIKYPKYISLKIKDISKSI